MKTLIAQIKDWFNRIAAEAKSEKDYSRYVDIENESRQYLQVMEFKGKLYICYKGIPFIQEDQLISGITESLEKSRNAYVEYIINKES